MRLSQKRIFRNSKAGRWTAAGHDRYEVWPRAGAVEAHGVVEGNEGEGRVGSQEAGVRSGLSTSVNVSAAGDVGTGRTGKGNWDPGGPAPMRPLRGAAGQTRGRTVRPQSGRCSSGPETRKGDGWSGRWRGVCPARGL